MFIRIMSMIIFNEIDYLNHSRNTTCVDLLLFYNKYPHVHSHHINDHSQWDRLLEPFKEHNMCRTIRILQCPILIEYYDQGYLDITHFHMICISLS